MKYLMGTIIFFVMTSYLQPLSAAVLHGQVQHRNRAPVGGIEIAVQTKNGRSVKKIRTNSSGVYSVDLDPGSYKLVVKGLEFSVRISKKKKRKDLTLP